MKRLILELSDSISDVVSVTAVGNHFNEYNQIVTNVKSVVIDLEEDVTTAQVIFEDGEE